MISRSAFSAILYILLVGCPVSISAQDVSELPDVFGPLNESRNAISAEALDSVSFPKWPGGQLMLNSSGLSQLSMRLSAIRNAPEAVTRGPKEAALYQELSPRVVMVLTNDSLGSGALINELGDIITNWHVVGGYEIVDVIFKPRREGANPFNAQAYRARVVKIDEVRDLALLRVEEVPSGIAPMTLGNTSDVPVGSDVHAIGHPTGQTWTYTKGIVSQKRSNYEWVTESGKKHSANVIQTQTPINPGNSGGPLISDSKELVGINSFKSEGEALNFAVSVDEVRAFLSQQGSRYARSAVEPNSPPPRPEECDGLRQVGDPYRDDDDDVTYIDLDIDCDGVADGAIMNWDDPNLPLTYVFDFDKDGLIDISYYDVGRDGSIDRSLHDTDKDGEPDLLGYHRNNEPDPYKFETYAG